VSLRQALVAITPSPIVRAARRLTQDRGNGFFGNYRTFAEALADSTGYDTEAVARSAMAPVTIPTEVADQILSVLPEGVREVLDVGGAGGHYCRLIRSRIPDVRCTVLETPGLVKVLQPLAPDWLRFVERAEGSFDLALMSGVLQYLERPLEMFDSISARHVIINRHPAIEGSRDRLTVQRVSKPYRATYPAWFFSRQRFMDHVRRTHEVVTTWKVPHDAPLLDGRRIVFEGMLLTRLTKA
jgi:putative methyltransferase (TIGR04325 family)